MSTEISIFFLKIYFKILKKYLSAYFSLPVKKEYYKYLINHFGILFTFHSNRIEGTNTTLTLNDTKEILSNTYDLTKALDKN